ncbi:MFS transporter [Streptomyces sp. NBC_00444]|uniref:MFS transporter n=1 Tax=unclassified Streptomyces TaxID=2593676 RepID=UPI003FA6EA02
MIAIDLTIVNVALPRIRRELGFTPEGLTWVVNAYMLAAGGLMLLGGRLGDLLGRRRMFMIGTALFGVASLTAGLAVSPGMLIASRFAQGMGEALAVPAGLAIVALIFPDEKERAQALGIWGSPVRPGRGGRRGPLRGPDRSGRLALGLLHQSSSRRGAAPRDPSPGAREQGPGPPPH